MAELTPLEPNKRLNPKTYHPDLQAAVEAAYAQGIELVVFPALLRGDKVGEVVKYLTDATTVRKKPCGPCAKAGHACILHNGSSLRCLHCYVGDARECTHQTGMYMQNYSKSCTDIQGRDGEARAQEIPSMHEVRGGTTAGAHTSARRVRLGR